MSSEAPNHRHFWTEQVGNNRLFHDKAQDVLTTYAANFALNGKRVDVTDLLVMVKGLMAGVTVTYWRSSNADHPPSFFVRFTFPHEMFLMFFKAMLLPGERGWLKEAGAWYVRENAEPALLRLCKVFDIPIVFLEAEPADD